MFGGFIDGFVLPPGQTVHVQTSYSIEQFITNVNFLAWKMTEKLIKGWILGTLSEEILHQVVGIDAAADVRTALKSKFNKATMDRELALHQNIQTLRRDCCDSLDDYLGKY